MMFNGLSNPLYINYTKVHHYTFDQRVFDV